MGFLIVGLSFIVADFILKYETVLQYLYGSEENKSVIGHKCYETVDMEDKQSNLSLKKESKMMKWTDFQTCTKHLIILIPAFFTFMFINAGIYQYIVYSKSFSYVH